MVRQKNSKITNAQYAHYNLKSTSTFAASSYNRIRTWPKNIQTLWWNQPAIFQRPKWPPRQLVSWYPVGCRWDPLLCQYSCSHSTRRRSAEWRAPCPPSERSRKSSNWRQKMSLQKIITWSHSVTWTVLPRPKELSHLQRHAGMCRISCIWGPGKRTRTCSKY